MMCPGMLLDIQTLERDILEHGPVLIGVLYFSCCGGFEECVCAGPGVERRTTYDSNHKYIG